MDDTKGPLLWFGRGKRIDPFNFSREQLDPGWIGIGLSRVARFGGAGLESVNVAAHSLTLSHLVGSCIHRQRAALMHDVPEIFTGDVPSPIKHRCADLLAIDQRIIDRIAFVYRIPHWAFEAIKPADKAIADDEKLLMFDQIDPEDEAKARAGRLGVAIGPMSREDAAAAWTNRFHQLFTEDHTIA